MATPSKLLAVYTKYPVLSLHEIVLVVLNHRERSGFLRDSQIPQNGTDCYDGLHFRYFQGSPGFGLLGVLDKLRQDTAAEEPILRPSDRPLAGGAQQGCSS